MVEFVAPGESFLGKGRMRAMAQGQRDYLQFDRKLAQADASTFWTRLTTSAVRDEEENFLHAVRPFDQMLAGATDRTVVDRPYIRANGNTMWARTTASAVRDGQGAFLYAIRAVEDITDRRAAEQDLAASREELVLTNSRNESIRESAGEGIIACDSTGAIVSINPAATAMMRVTAAEAIGSRPSDIVTLRTAEGSAFRDDEHILSLVLHDGETRTTIAESMERKDGSAVVIDRVGTAQRDATGTRVVGGVITMRDVSDRAEIEKAKAGFFAATSHGLRTPLTAIHASIGFVASGVLGGLPEKAARQIDIAVDASSDLVSCDAALITQVLTNLLGNAIKYSPAGSTINVTALADDRVITVAVSDPGPGIPPESIPTLFEEFQRVDSIANREQQGTGLGLAIAKAIVERHHGRI